MENMLRVLEWRNAMFSEEKMLKLLLKSSYLILHFLGEERSQAGEHHKAGRWQSQEPLCHLVSKTLLPFWKVGFLEQGCAFQKFT
jgi:hypothetical protein